MTDSMTPLTCTAPAVLPVYSCILFDLDGTITDSAPGITDRIRRTLLELGVPVPDDLMRWVGPPLLESFQQRAGMSVVESRMALEAFGRHVRAQGPYGGSTVFAGIRELLTDLHADGVPMAIATSKPESDAAEILNHFGLDHCFKVIAGATDDEARSSKGDVIAHALEQLRALAVDATRPLMIGDRVHDVDGAGAFGIPTVLVGWGYGNAVVESVDAWTTVASAEELSVALTGRFRPAADPRDLAGRGN